MKYAAFIRYGNHEQIAEVRPKHRQYLGGLHEQGKIFASGPFADDSGALIIYEGESEDEVRDIIRNDPFYIAGVFKHIDLREWRRVY
jgi:uncharacterized protein YciI